MQDNLVGGPSIVFHCKQVAGVTSIHGNPEQIVKSIVGYDANALYLWCTSQNMPCGRPNVHRLDAESGTLKKDSDPDVSEKQNMWLSEVVREYPDLQYGIKKRRAENRPAEVKG